MKSKKKKILLTFLVILAFITFVITWNYFNDNSNSEDFSEEVFATKIIDGDTIVANGEHIRLLGIDADERGYECYKEAKIRLEELILNKEVRLEKDKTNKDQYGRLLRYIFLGKDNVNIQLVEEGLAVARFYEDRKYKKEILDAEKTARANKTGCKWGRI